MGDLFLPSLDDQVAEVERELAVRRGVYPRLIAARRLSREAAERQMARLEAAAATLARVRDGQAR